MVYPVDGETVIQNGYKYPAVTVEVGENRVETIAEAYLHDDRRLPHEIGGDLNLLFPKARAAPELDETLMGEDPLEARGLAIGRAARG